MFSFFCMRLHVCVFNQLFCMEHFIIIYVLKPRSVSGKKLCSSCGLPLGKGAAMIIETLNLYFHIQCFRVCICHSSKYNLWCLSAFFCAEKHLLNILMTFAHKATPSMLYRSLRGIHLSGWNSLLSCIPLGCWLRKSKTVLCNVSL